MPVQAVQDAQGPPGVLIGRDVQNLPEQYRDFAAQFGLAPADQVGGVAAVHHPGDGLGEVGGQVGPVTLRDGVASYHTLLEEDVDELAASAHLNCGTDVPGRKAVVAPLEADVLVGVNLGRSPLGELEHHGGKRLQRRPLHLGEGPRRRYAYGPVDLGTVDVHAPPLGPGAQLLQALLGMQGAQLAVEFPDGLDHSLHLALLGGAGHPAGVDEEAVVVGGLRQAPVEHRVIDVGLDDPGLEVVQAHPPGHAAPEGEHGDDRGDERALGLSPRQTGRRAAGSRPARR